MNLLVKVAESWWDWMGFMFLQVALLISVVTVIDMLIRRWVWPQARYALWLLVFLKLIIPPTWTLSSGIVPNIQPLEKQLHILDTTAPSVVTPKNLNHKVDFKGAETKQPTLKQPVSTSIPWQVYAMTVWLGGMGFFISILGVRIGRLRRWHREQREKKKLPQYFYNILVKTSEQLGIRQLPAIVFSPQAVTPAVYGLFRPVLLLPKNYFEDLSEEEAQHVMLHELAHLKRGDLFIHAICLVLQIVYWFNPFMIWVRKQVKHVREICCDLTVANRLKEKTKMYRQTLLNTAKELLTETVEPGMGLLGIFEEPFRLVS